MKYAAKTYPANDEGLKKLVAEANALSAQSGVTLSFVAPLAGSLIGAIFTRPTRAPSTSPLVDDDGGFLPGFGG